ncbi:MAG: FHA domain-containing protein [Planctomycetaceae bacterium]|nr:FHA domain-containing protein [Planctomycetaceae bacterium]
MTIHLLDSAEGHPIQTWHFKEQSRVNIGRSGENDICITDGRVSRLHVELRHCENHWELISHGRNGTLVGGVAADNLPLVNGDIFQLGPSGPTFRFADGQQLPSGTATISAEDTENLDFLMIDEQLRADDVRQIAETDVFQRLQQQAQQMKQDSDARGWNT